MLRCILPKIRLWWTLRPKYQNSLFKPVVTMRFITVVFAIIFGKQFRWIDLEAISINIMSSICSRKCNYGIGAQKLIERRILKAQTNRTLSAGGLFIKDGNLEYSVSVQFHRINRNSRLELKSSMIITVVTASRLVLPGCRTTRINPKFMHHGISPFIHHFLKISSKII